MLLICGESVSLLMLILKELVLQYLFGEEAEASPSIANTLWHV